MFVICMLLQMQKGQCFITKEFDMWKEISSLVYSEKIEIKLYLSVCIPLVSCGLRLYVGESTEGKKFGNLERRYSSN